VVPYGEALEIQKHLVELRKANEIPDQLLLLEHPPVITLGVKTRNDRSHVVASAETLDEEGVEVFESGRGGDVTYHGPGQLVGYPIMDLRPDRCDVHRYVRDLEEVLIRVAAAFGVAGGRSSGLTGVWVGDEKLAAIGVRIARWVTSHGFALNVSTGVPEQALRSRMPFSGATRDIDPEFVAKFGAPADDHVLVLPLLLKEKVAALVYADAGADGSGRLDAAAVELLVLATSAWLEVASLRKQAHKEESTDAAGEKTEITPPPSAPAHSDPFAAHPPKHIAPEPEPVPPPPAVAEQPAAVAQTEPVVAAAAAAPAPATDAFANLSPEDADVHRKAHRFARLLVDEIKLYNQVKVSEGRKNRDLYDRLKEDIEKSRITYQKRYGNTAAGGADYFGQELVRSLAEDDTSIMGANFRRN